MPWFRVDDDLARHRKVLSISRRDRAAAMGLWCLAGAWSAANLTDGLVPEYLPQELGCAKRLADVLVEAGLWSREGRAWRFHAWDERQPSRAQTEAKRSEERERKARWREEQKEKRRSDGKSDDVSQWDTQRDEQGDTQRDSAPPVPDPTRPVPDPTPLPTEGGTTPSTTSRTPSHGFEEFWAAYPRRQGKADAEKAWRQRKCSTIAANVIAGAARYRDDPNREPQFTKMPAGWIREGRWTDDPLPPRRSRGTAGANDDHAQQVFAASRARANQPHLRAIGDGT